MVNFFECKNTTTFKKEKRERQVCLWRQKAFLAGRKSRVSGLSFHFSPSLSFCFSALATNFHFQQSAPFASRRGEEVGPGGNLIKK